MHLFSRQSIQNTQNTYDYVIGSMQEYPLDLQAQQVVYNLCERGWGGFSIQFEHLVCTCCIHEMKANVTESLAKSFTRLCNIIKLLLKQLKSIIDWNGKMCI